MTKKERAGAVIKILKKVYLDAHCELDFQNPLQLLVATILSAQCTDKRVNSVTPGLFEKYRDARALAETPQETLESEIKSTGFYRNKAKNIRLMAQDLVAKHGGNVPQSMEELVELAGVGRKTANVVLGNAFGRNEGIVVDTHVSRLSTRLKLTSAKDPEKIEQDLIPLVDRKDWTLFSHWLIWHGRRRCFARNPDCTNCELSEICPSRQHPVARLKAQGPRLN
jgi:endonuclease III